MIVDERLMICALLSVAAHFAFGEGLRQLPELEPPRPPPVLAIRVIENPPPPAPEPPAPEPPPPEPPPPTALPPPRTPPKITHAQVKAAPPVATPEVPHPPTTTDTTTTPVFGVSMDSTSQGGSGPAMQVGNTVQPQAPTRAPPTQTVVKPLAAPIAAYEATKPPLPQGRCFGKYTEAAHAAGTEGTVVLDLIVGVDGRAREIHVAQGLPNGLSEAAVAALQACHFTPGEKDGQPVAVKVRGFKITFVVADDQ
jgi:protein TonB